MESETAVHEVIFKDAKIKDVCSDEGVSFVPDGHELIAALFKPSVTEALLKEINKVGRLEM